MKGKEASEVEGGGMEGRRDRGQGRVWANGHLTFRKKRAKYFRFTRILYEGGLIRFKLAIQQPEQLSGSTAVNTPIYYSFYNTNFVQFFINPK